MVKYPNAASGIKKVFLAKIIGVMEFRLLLYRE